MAKVWDGKDCGRCELLWENNAKNRSEYQAYACREINGIHKEISGMVSWKVFTFLFSFSVIVVGSGFTFFGASLVKIGDKHEASMDRLEATISGMALNQSVMMVKMVEIEKRQDVLRDSNMKILHEIGVVNSKPK